MAYWSPGIVSRIVPSSRCTMGCISGITSLVIQSSISAWLSVGTGGSLAVMPLRAFFPIARLPAQNSWWAPGDSNPEPAD